MKEYLAVYDIADPKRLRRVANLMKRYGIRVQKSVFECRLAGRDFQQLCRDADKELDPEADGIRIYPLHARARDKQTLFGIENMISLPNAYIA